MALFIYSLGVLKALCSACTLYYLLSWALSFLFYKFGLPWGRPSPKILGVYMILALPIVGPISFSLHEKEKHQMKLGESLYKQFKELPTIGEPKTPSPFKIHSSTVAFSEAPIRLSIYSDFQCPGCKALSDMLPLLIKRYQGKINIQYFFFPLDKRCNPNVKEDFHLFACEASFLAYCRPEDFKEVHDHIFSHQRDLDAKWIKTYAQDLGATQCMKDPATEKAITQMIQSASEFSIRSTPTIIINGVKLVGLLSKVSQYYAILDPLARGQKK